MTPEQAVTTILAGVVGTAVVEIFKRVILRLNGFWSVILLIGVSFGLAAAVLAALHQTIDFFAVIAIATLIYTAVKAKLPAFPG